jgi:hypothetical protein
VAAALAAATFGFVNLASRGVLPNASPGLRGCRWKFRMSPPYMIWACKVSFDQIALSSLCMVKVIAIRGPRVLHQHLFMIKPVHDGNASTCALKFIKLQSGINPPSKDPTCFQSAIRLIIRSHLASPRKPRNCLPLGRTGPMTIPALRSGIRAKELLDSTV